MNIKLHRVCSCHNSAEKVVLSHIQLAMVFTYAALNFRNYSLHTNLTLVIIYITSYILRCLLLYSSIPLSSQSVFI